MLWTSDSMADIAAGREQRGCHSPARVCGADLRGAGAGVLGTLYRAARSSGPNPLRLWHHLVARALHGRHDGEADRLTAGERDVDEVGTRRQHDPAAAELRGATERAPVDRDHGPCGQA